LRWVPIVTTTILTSLLTTGAQAGYYAVFTWLPTFVRTEPKLTVLGTGGYIAMVIIGSFVGYLVSAYLTDRIPLRSEPKGEARKAPKSRREASFAPSKLADYGTAPRDSPQMVSRGSLRSRTQKSALR
jgi:hypothetical protein